MPRHGRQSLDEDLPVEKTGIGHAMGRLLSLMASPEMRRWRPLMAGALAITGVSKLLALASPVLLGDAINHIAEGAAAGAAGTFVALVLAYGASRWLSSAMPQLRDAFFARVSQDAQRLVAVRAFAHVQQLSLRFHQSRRTGTLSRVIDRGASAIDFLLRFLVFNIAPTLVELALAAILLSVRYGWPFAAIAVVTIGLYAGSTFYLTEWRVKLRRRMNDADNEASARAVDAFVNFETVKAFAAERRETERFDTARTDYAQAAAKSQASLATLNALQGFIMNAGLLAMALLSGLWAIQGRLGVGDITAVTLVLMQLYAPLNILGWAYREIKQGAVDMERMFGLLKLDPEVADAPDAKALPAGPGEVRFEGVAFAHDGRASGVEDVTLTIPAGSFVGLVGPSGAGKSTLLRLLFRFYDPQAGRILIDGQDIRGVTQETLRGVLGLVPQEVVLFNDTLRENVAYARPEASEAELVDALERAQLGAFVRSLPNGLDTRVGERGLKLSGGEKQRVGVARAILRDPKILVLDEATSSLDSQTESEVQAALAEAAKGRTTVAVAHRLSTIAGADRIYVLDDGRVAEAGTHAELVRAGGLYAAMWKRQAEAAERPEPKVEAAE